MQHRNLSAFFNNELLSDIDVTNPASGTAYKYETLSALILYRCHKVVLASASDLFESFLKEADFKALAKVPTLTLTFILNSSQFPDT